VVQSGTEWPSRLRSWGREAEKEEPVEIRPESRPNNPNQLSLTKFCAVFTSPVAVVVTDKEKEHVSRQSPNSRGRKGATQSPIEFKRVIDEKYGAEKFYITSLDGKVAQVYPFEEWERIEQKLAALSTFNPTKKKFLSRVNYYGQSGRDGRPGPVADAAVVARVGADQGRSCGYRQSDLSRSCAIWKRTARTRSRKSNSRLTMRRRSTNWASSQPQRTSVVRRTPKIWGGWANTPGGGSGSEPCSSSFKRSDRLSKRQRDGTYIRRHGGLGRDTVTKSQNA
jgi:hypothetical protein